MTASSSLSKMALPALALCLLLADSATARFSLGSNPVGKWANESLQDSDCALYWSLGSTGDDGNPNPPYIVDVSTVLEAPAETPDQGSPPGLTGAFAMFPAMQSTAGNMIQSIIASFLSPDGENTNKTKLTCNDAPSPYCAASNVWSWNDQQEVITPMTPIYSGQLIPVKYSYNSSDNSPTCNQDAVTSGNNVSTGPMNVACKGPFPQYLLRVENKLSLPYLPDPTGQYFRTPTHTYHNTSIRLSERVPDFNKTLQKLHVDDSGLYTNDGGMTWQVDSVTLRPMMCAMWKLNSLEEVTDASKSGNVTQFLPGEEPSPSATGTGVPVSPSGNTAPVPAGPAPPGPAPAPPRRARRGELGRQA